MIQTVKLNDGGGFVVTLTGGDVLYVPDDPANRHHREVQDWIALGNTPDPADPLPPVDKTSPLSNQEIEELIVAGTLNAAAVAAKKNARQ